MQNIENLKYPIGKFEKKESYEPEELELFIDQIMRLPHDLEKNLRRLDKSKLDQPYRPDGWTLRQVVHHLADSHCNGFARLKFALTENHPEIKPYNENAWAHLQDACELPIDSSIQILKGVHERFSYLLRQLDDEQLEKKYFHPQHNSDFSIAQMAANYAWHGRHHLAHILLVINAN